MTFMPKQIQEAFRLTGRLLNNPNEASSKALFKALSADGDWQEYTQGFQKWLMRNLVKHLKKQESPN